MRMRLEYTKSIGNDGSMRYIVVIARRLRAT